MVEEAEFEVISPTEDLGEESSTPPPQRVRRLCACGCGEEVTGNRALKRGHSMGDGISQSSLSGNDIVVFQSAFIALTGAITAFGENKWGIPRTEPEESKAIGEPLGRIAARHIPKAVLRKMKPGDAADVLLIATTVTAYVLRITTTKTKETPANASNGLNDDQAVSGLSQYQYRPPEQNFQQENGFAA